MEHPILVLPHWIKERLNITKLTRHSVNDLENVLSDEELLWVMSLHKFIPSLHNVAKRMYDLYPSERIRDISSYEMSVSDVKHACGTCTLSSITDGR